jgi:hypothetical protein
METKKNAGGQALVKKWNAKLAERAEPRTKEWRPYRPSKQMEDAVKVARLYK